MTHTDRPALAGAGEPPTPAVGDELAVYREPGAQSPASRLCADGNARTYPSARTYRIDVAWCAVEGSLA